LRDHLVELGDVYVQPLTLGEVMQCLRLERVDQLTNQLHVVSL
jgi:hypothetical protein